MTYKKQNERQNKKMNLQEFSTYDFEGNLDDVIAKLLAVKENNPNYFDFMMEEETEIGYYNERYTTFTVFAWRKETDKEMEYRINKNKQARAKKREENKRIKEEKEASDKAEFARLAKKFKYEVADDFKM